MQVLKGLGMRKALIVHSQGLDELTPMGPAEVVEVTGDSSHSYRCALACLLDVMRSDACPALEPQILLAAQICPPEACAVGLRG